MGAPGPPSPSPGPLWEEVMKTHPGLGALLSLWLREGRRAGSPRRSDMCHSDLFLTPRTLSACSPEEVLAKSTLGLHLLGLPP